MLNIRQFIKNNKYSLITLFFINVVATISIGIINYPYIDDVSRRINGSTTYAEYYSRHLSEYVSWFISGSRHLVDTGLTTFFVNALFLFITEASVLYVLFGKNKLPYLQVLSVAIIGINPWFLEPISFRFDGPLMSLSLFVSVVPFLFYNSKKWLYFLVSTIGIFLMCNSYQASSGIYPLMLLTLIFFDLHRKKSLQTILPKICIGLGAYIIGMLAFWIEASLNPNVGNANTSIAKLSDLIPVMVRNYRLYFTTIWQQSSTVWLLVFLLILVAFLLSNILIDKKQVIINTCLALVYVLIGFLFSFGVFAVFTATLAVDRPRYIYGFGFFVAILLVQIFNKWDSSLLIRSTAIALSSLALFYFSSFVLTYGTVLEAQKTDFELQSERLSSDLANYTSETETIYTNRLFKDSLVYENSLKNYPILDDLVVSNSTIYWPNVMWFNTLSHMNVDFVQFDLTSVMQSEQSERLVDNYYYTLYKNGDNFYLYMK